MALVKFDSFNSRGKDIRWKWLEERGLNVKADPAQYRYMQSLWLSPDEEQGTFCESPAGTGKTVLAVLAGAYGVEKEDFDRIIYIRNTEVVGKGIGFLPGEFDNKVGPHMAPFADALDLVKPGTFEKWVEEGKAVATTATFLRGVTFKKAFIILDEVQNMSMEEQQTIHTRVTADCKVVSIGSLRQMDNQNLKRIAGLTPFEVFMKHFESKGSSFHHLTTNYRGDWSLHSDNIQDTIKALIEEQKQQ